MTENMKRLDSALTKLSSAITEETKYFLVSAEQLARLEQIAKRLYTEQRMNGDQMRDAAHAIMGVVNVTRELPAE